MQQNLKSEIKTNFRDILKEKKGVIKVKKKKRRRYLMQDIINKLKITLKRIIKAYEKKYKSRINKIGNEQIKKSRISTTVLSAVWSVRLNILYEL